MRAVSPYRAATQATILLVDDNNDGNLARRSVLEELGYKVVPARSGTEALKLLESEAFDLVVTDFKMTPVDGLELIKRLRAGNFVMPIILLTGFADNLGLRADVTGADVVIQKSANEIVMLVRHAKRLLSAPRKPSGSQKAKAARQSESRR
jgi:CheY-like chemotaxis protein